MRICTTRPLIAKELIQGKSFRMSISSQHLSRRELLRAATCATAGTMIGIQRSWPRPPIGRRHRSAGVAHSARPGGPIACRSGSLDQSLFGKAVFPRELLNRRRHGCYLPGGGRRSALCGTGMVHLPREDPTLLIIRNRWWERRVVLPSPEDATGPGTPCGIPAHSTTRRRTVSSPPHADCRWQR